MRLIMIRHGDPDYEKDCLTALGRRQAMAAAERLEREGIEEICASPMGRAVETASFTASRLKKEIRVLDFMHEISWGGPGVPENGHPWTLALRLLEEENPPAGEKWREHAFFRNNAATACYDAVAENMDRFLEELGYRREGKRYLCLEHRDRTVALFSHGGSGACAIAHILSLPFPFVLGAMPYDFTSVIILNFPDRPGQAVFPRIELFNDTAHMSSAPGPVFQRRPDETDQG